MPKLQMDFRSLPIRDRLLLYSHVTQMGCWEWQGTCFKSTGYAQITYEKVIFAGHRLSYALFNECTIPDNTMVLHHCDNKICINPSHLYLGDHAQNTKDAVERGRLKKGSAHPNAKLNEHIVAEIIAEIKKGRTLKAIATDYGICPSAVSQIRRNKIWKHVPRS